MVTWVVVILAAVAVLGLPLFAGKYFFRNSIQEHKADPSSVGVDYTEVRIPTKDEKTLFGWWMEKESDEPLPTMIILHGWGRNADRALPYIDILKNEPYHILAFDSRNHGNSDPDSFSSMLKFAEDIIAAIKWVSAKPEVLKNQLGLIGLSIGGSASLYAAALSPQVKAVATVGAFSHPITVLDAEFSKRHVPRYPFRWAFYRYFELLSHKRIKSIAPINNMGIIEGNVFLIHGTEDKTIPHSEVLRLEKAGVYEKVTRWSVQGYGHSDCHNHPEFQEKLLTFFREYLR